MELTTLKSLYFRFDFSSGCGHRGFQVVCRVYPFQWSKPEISISKHYGTIFVGPILIFW